MSAHDPKRTSRNDPSLDGSPEKETAPGLRPEAVSELEFHLLIEMVLKPIAEMLAV